MTIWEICGSSTLKLDISLPDGDFGTRGAESKNSYPSSRYGSAAWFHGGYFWLFGGAAQGEKGYSNNLWRYNPSSNLWMYVEGSKTGGASSSFNPKYPGGRYHVNSCSSVASSNLLYFFGGWVVDGIMSNQLWSYDISTSQWELVSGNPDETVTPTTNAPKEISGRVGQICWVDAKGIVYVFGGYGRSTGETSGALNDVWQFESGKWTNIAGDPVAINKSSHFTGVQTPGGCSDVGGYGRANKMFIFGGESPKGKH